MPFPRPNSVVIFTISFWLLTPIAHADFQAGADAYKRGDYLTALQEWRPLANQLDADAQFLLGKLYAEGKGVPQNEKEAVRWWRISATQRHVHAQYSLGHAYAIGQGVPLDIVQAHMWLSLATAQGQQEALEERDEIATTMTATQIAEAQRLAQEWDPKTSKIFDYTLELKKNNTLIYLQGGLEFGVSDEVSQLLVNYSDVTGIILDSQGGRIHEGRKLADLISSYRLNTYSLLGCYSACATAFIAGKNRFLGPQANLAFHQYSDGPGLNSPQSDVRMKKEEEQDRKFYQQQGVSAEFLEKLFNTPFNDLWYPPVKELLMAGVVHGLVNPSDLFPYEYEDLRTSDFFNELLNIPIYQTIKKYDPSTFKEISDSAIEQIQNGASPIELREVFTNYIKAISNKLLPYTSNEALINFAKNMVSTLKNFVNKDPILCMKLLLRKQYGEVPSESYSKKDLENINEVMTRVIIDAYEKDNPQVDTNKATIVMRKVRLKIEDEYKALKTEELQNSADYKRFCNVRIKFYELILSEGDDAGGNALRYAFSPK
ncbi:MAG TPA: hypothetical protein PKK23_19165 [Nitrospirales bacterium]|nr:hypothetical protein [Nitrospiraceae bacterium]HNP31175.1 hypothetical protein [Nitrospirales bacterium]